MTAYSNLVNRRDVLAGGMGIAASGLLAGGSEAAPMRAAMPLVVDASVRCGDAAKSLASSGVKVVVRYYARAVQKNYEEKILTADEAKAIFAGGLAVALCYQHNHGQIESFTKPLAKAAVDYCLARNDTKRPHPHGVIAHPEGTVIYFGIDAPFAEEHNEKITTFFDEVNRGLRRSPFKVGVYGPGRHCKMLAKAGLASRFWLPGSTSWAGTVDFYNGKDSVPAWHLYQKAVEVPFEYKPGGDKRAPVKELRVDTNVLNPKAMESLGAFKGNELFGSFDDEPIRRNERFLVRGERFLKNPGGQEAHVWIVQRGPARFEPTSELRALKMITLLKTSDDGRWAEIEAVVVEKKNRASSEVGLVLIGHVPASSLTSIAAMPA